MPGKSSSNMQSKYKDSRSFNGKTLVVLALSGIIPYLLMIYLVVYGKIDLNDTIVVFFALAIFCGLTGFVIIRRFADQLGYLSKKTGSIKAEKKGAPIQINADQELNDIADHFNSILKELQHTDRKMKDQSLQLILYAEELSSSYKKLKEEKNLKKQLSKYVGTHLIDKLISSKSGVLFKDERKEVTILFADIRSFTSISEKLPAEDVVEMLNLFFNAMVDIIFKNNGILDKFIGDQIMAIFTDISPQISGPTEAIKAAIEMQNATEKLMKIMVDENKKTFEIGIGINTGNAIFGNVGSENRMDFTAIGNCVNVAARLEQLAKGGEIVIGEKTFLQAHGNFHIQDKEQIFVKNKIKPIICYKVLR